MHTMSDEQDKLKLSLEPPRLFGRKKKPASAETGPVPAADAPPAAEQTAAPARPTPAAKKATAGKPAPEKAAPAPQADPVEEAPAEVKWAPEQTPAPATEDTRAEVADYASEVVLDEEADAAARDETAGTAIADAETTVAEEEPATRTVDEPEPTTAAGAPTAAQAPEQATPANKKPAKKSVPAGSAAVGTPAKKPAPRPAPEVVPVPVELDRAELEDAEIAARLADEGPLLPLYPAAAVTGALVGGAMVLLTWLSLRGCEAVRGTSSCGGGPGFLLLVATFVVCVLLGSALLRTFSVPDPGSTSFLAVGLVAVIALLFLIDVLDTWPMLIVIPVISVIAFLVSVWVTKTFVEPGESS